MIWPFKDGVWPFNRGRKRLRERIEHLERMAEEAYDAMYDSRRPQDEWRDVRELLSEAIHLARKAGLTEDAERLDKRLEHIRAVYTHRFR